MERDGARSRERNEAAGQGRMMAGTAILAACGLFAASVVCDLRRRRIPNAIPIGLVAAFVVHAVAGGAGSPRGVLLSVAIGLALLVLGFLLYLGGGFGAGDAKLMAVAGLWVGLEHLGQFLLTLAGIAFFICLVVLLPFEASRKMRREIPFAVAIAPSAVAVIAPRILAPGIHFWGV